MNRGTRTLMNWEVRLLRRYRQGGWSHAELSSFFGVSQSVVSRICTGAAYKDSGGPVEASRVYRKASQ